jgi:hypothetical protein
MDGSVKRRLVHAVNWHYWRSIFLVVAMALRCWTPKTDIIAEGAKQIQRKLSVVAQSMAGWEFQSMKQSDNGRFRVNRSKLHPVLRGVFRNLTTGEEVQVAVAAGHPRSVRRFAPWGG